MSSTWKTLAHHLLCAPGEGVYTVNTAKERKLAYQSKLYPGAPSVDRAWKASLEQICDTTPLLLGVCSDSGGGILRGANWGPLFIRGELLEKYSYLQYQDLGDIRVIPHLLHDKYLNEETLKNCRKALYADENSSLPVSPLSITEHFLTSLYAERPEAKVFALGGDHSVSLPLTRAFLRARKKLGKNVGLLHFDAHTDLLVERLGIDYCFGSWCTHILADLVDPSCLVQVGIRSSGKERNHWEKTFGVIQHWSEDVKRRGPLEVIGEVINHYKALAIDELYISFDIDALDSSYASATGTPEADGLSPDQASMMIQEITKHFPLKGADMVEVAPFVSTRKDIMEPEMTLKSAGIISALMIEAMK
jgi:agmatinase